MPLKLLIYSHFFPPSVGGVEAAVFSLARGLATLENKDGRAPFDVTVATCSGRDEFDDAAAGFRIVRRPNPVTLLKLIQRADLLHIAGPALAPLCLAFCTRTPAVITHHGYQATCLNGLLLENPGPSVCPGNFLLHRYAKCVRCYACESSVGSALLKLLLMAPRHFLSRKAAANIAVTNHVMNRQKLPRSEVIYHGLADPLPSDASRHEVVTPLCFAYVGRLVHEKGVLVLLAAAALLRKEQCQFRILLIGDGPQRQELERTIKEGQLEDIVQMAGYLRGSQLEEALREVDVVVVPSICEETAGLSAIDQMSRGRLVIASDIGGLSEVVGSAGVRFPPGDAPALAGAMKSVIKDPSSYERVTRHARARALEMFNLSRMIGMHADLYGRIVRKRD